MFIKIKKFFQWILPIPIMVLGFSQVPTSFNIPGYSIRYYDCSPSKEYYDAKVNDPNNPQNKQIYALVRELTLIEYQLSNANCEGYLVEVAEIINAADDVEALSKVTIKAPVYRFYKDNIETYKLRGEKTAAIIKKNIITKITDFLFSSAHATYPTESFDSYSTGDLNGNNGGSDWSNSWGAGTQCETDWDVGTGAPQGGANSAQISLNTDANDKCQRQLSHTYGGEEVEFWVRQSVTNNRLILGWHQGSDESAPGMNFYMRQTGQLAAIDNVTFVDQQAYLADTWYHICEKGFSDETWNIAINTTAGTCGTYSVAYNMHDYTNVVYTQTTFIHLQDGADVSSGTGYVDTISPVAGAAAAQIIQSYSFEE